MPRKSGLILITVLFVPFFAASTVTSEWKNDITDPNLMKIVNFLINNKGKDVVLAGEKHKITGNEEIDVVVKVQACCTLFFNQGIEAVSAYGKIKNSNFKKASVHALIPAEKIPEMEASSKLILGVSFELEAKNYWMHLLNITKEKITQETGSKQVELDEDEDEEYSVCGD